MAEFFFSDVAEDSKDEHKAHKWLLSRQEQYFVDQAEMHQFRFGVTSESDSRHRYAVVQHRLETPGCLAAAPRLIVCTHGH